VSVLAAVESRGILAIPSFAENLPTAADAIDRVKTNLLPHQQKFLEDTEHRKLALVCGFGAGKSHGLVA